jgi:hypothetical protein
MAFVTRSPNLPPLHFHSPSMSTELNEKHLANLIIGIQGIPENSTVTLRVSNVQVPDEYTSVDTQWLCK